MCRPHRQPAGIIVVVDNVAALERRAIDYAKQGDFGPAARETNQELARLAPANIGAWTRLARCCLELGLLDEATAALDAALQLNPQNTIARNLQIEVSRRRAGPAVDAVRPRRRASGTPASGNAGGTRAAAGPRGRAGVAALAGIGRAEISALAHLAPAAAVESLTARLEPLMMALNDRPFALKVVEARNRAGHAGSWLFRRGSLRAGSHGHIYAFQQGGRWEPQLNISLYAGQTWNRDALAAAIVFDLASDGTDDRAEAGRERLFQYFEVFRQQLSSTWRQHLTDWMRTNGGFVQLGDNPPSTDLLPYDAVERLIRADAPAGLGRIAVGRWLFADRAEDMTVLMDGPRLVRWIEATFTDLLPLWATVYRAAR